MGLNRAVTRGHGGRNGLIGPFATRPEGEALPEDGLAHFGLTLGAISGVRDENAKDNNTGHATVLKLPAGSRPCAA